jgi:choline kinase
VKAILLSAGRGSRLLPWTANLPKCLVAVERGRPILEVQLRALAACGIRDVAVMVGYGAQSVEAFLATDPVPGLRTETLYNPFYDCSDNLLTCWLARSFMRDDFVLVNGDTLFEPRVLRTLLAAPPASLTLAVSEKDHYDDDDMKVQLDASGRVLRVDKNLEHTSIDAESIGAMVFRGDGPRLFCDRLEDAVREPSARESYYLKVVEQMASEADVRSASIGDAWWGEVDTPFDLAAVRGDLEACPTLLMKPHTLLDERACA